MGAQIGQAAKRPALVDRNVNVQRENSSEANEDESKDDVNEEDGQAEGPIRDALPCIAAEDVDVRRGRYHDTTRTEKPKKKGKHHSLARGSTIDDFVNATSRGLPC